jgi:hypothetical protein
MLLLPAAHTTYRIFLPEVFASILLYVPAGIISLSRALITLTLPPPITINLSSAT